MRLYLQLRGVDRAAVAPEVMLAAAQRILSPYSITHHYVDWFVHAARLRGAADKGTYMRTRSASGPGSTSASSTASSSQGVVSHSRPGLRTLTRADAVHTHSPRA